MTRGLLTLSLALAAALAARAEDVAVRVQHAFERVDTLVAREMKAQAVPGLALALTSREGLLGVRVYGWADVADRVPVAPETLFEIGSVSKAFTAIALLQLRDEGRFDPQAPVAKYLPWFQVQTRFAPITGHHLLTHTAGIPGDRDDIPSSTYQAYALRERETGYAPGTRYAYSNVGYQVLGSLLEALEKKPYPEVIRARLLEPLGMTRSAAEFTHDTRRRLAVGYGALYDDRPYHPSLPLAEATWLEYASGDGSIVSTAPDLAAYVRMLLNRGLGPKGRVLSESGFELLTQKAIGDPEEPGRSYGYGLSRRDGQGRVVLSHSGGMVGYASFILADLDAGLGVAVLTNLGAGEFRPRKVAAFAADAVHAAIEGRELRPLPAEGPELILKAHDFAGRYAAFDGRSLAFLAEEGRLYLLDGSERVMLQPWGEDSFYAPHPNFRLFPLRFGRQDEKVVEVAYGPNWYASEAYAGPRSFDAPKEWLAYPGHYRATHAWFNNFRIVLRKGKLIEIGPDGDESELVPLGPGLFQVGKGPTAERLRFDSVVDGKALRANFSGCDYYRSFTP